MLYSGFGKLLMTSCDSAVLFSGLSTARWPQPLKLGDAALAAYTDYHVRIFLWVFKVLYTIMCRIRVHVPVI